ncbi:hypothetical protein L226DRAFT_532256 [Lentinus tigrinus ALCF2SS1-7]|uniref:Protein BZZ1 n=1 Tax=Lentinus tigrinus ALCF2SS1-6 TaxID=1328759 RepID=A0A5C2SGJ4_9APHY|nr:hypothetical protein L227DRAFT_573289 [Lentinus tigrinus ALCF2SS1-6]RPD77466.1 hypothetical protein L226DRAFT_532256 [Lentinus tigrinus ALCF2SS1-7]
MASTASGQTYGQHIPDQVERIASVTDAQLELLEDVRDLHRERAALEREYAAKLQLLVKKAAEKKAKKMPALVVGNEPTKAWDEDTIRKSTLDQAYAQLLTSMSDAAQDHINLADALNGQVIDPLKATERKHEEAKKKEMQYYQKLLSDRDRAYADRIKSKQKYDEECSEVETYRQKQERSADDRHAERAAKQYEQQQIDMLNSKNAYLISIAVANKVKSKFYEEDLPALEDQFQDLQTRLLTRFVDILKNAQEVQLKHLDSVRSRLTACEAAFSAVNPAADQDLFIDHNVAPFSAPADWTFEPSPNHYDHGDMSVEPAPKVYLQNRLSKCRSKLEELEPVLTSKRKETEQLAKLVETYTANSSLGDADEVLDNYLDAHHSLTFYATSGVILTAETDTISAALGGDEGAQSPHSFKSTSFSIPATCAYCKSSIWGLSKQGKTCKACGVSVHSKCELKLPADCPGSRQSGRGHLHSDSISSLSRASSVLSHTSSTLATGQATPTPSSFAPSTHTPEESRPTARVLFDFTPTSPFELAVSAESTVHVLEEDDGSGWVKVADDSGGKGLVPASYVELLDGGQTPRSSTPSLSHQQTSQDYVRGVYAYKAQGPDEIDVEEGKLIQLTDGPNGGKNYADGWWEGIDASGKKGIFPSNYVEDA